MAAAESCRGAVFFSGASRSRHARGLLTKFTHLTRRPGSPACMAGAALSAKGSSLDNLNGEQVRDYRHKFEGGKAASAVVIPPQAH